MSYDGICEGRTGTLIPSGRGNLETNRETLFTAPTVSSEQTVKAEHLNFAEVRETQNSVLNMVCLSAAPTRIGLHSETGRTET